MEGWEQEGTDLKKGGKVVETTWQRRRGQSRRAGGGGIWILMRDIADGEKYHPNYIKGTEPNGTIAYAPGTEHQRLITSKIWGHGGRFEREISI